MSPEPSVGCPIPVRAVVRLRKQDKDERMEYEAVLETYMHALGLI